MTVKNKI